MPASTDYIDGTYLRQNPDWHVPDSAWKVRQILSILRRNRVVPRTVYDVGCGAGEILRLLQQQFDTTAEFWGTDVSPQAIRMCQAKANDSLHFALAGDFPCADRYFDLVIAMDVIAHVEDYRGFLRNLKSMGRYKLIHFPLDLSLQHILRESSMVECQRRHPHFHYFLKRTAMFALADLGFDIVDWAFTPRAIDIPGHTRGKFLRIPRKILFAINQDLAVKLLGGFSLVVLAR